MNIFKALLIKKPMHGGETILEYEVKVVYDAIVKIYTTGSRALSWSQRKNYSAMNFIELEYCSKSSTNSFILQEFEGNKTKLKYSFSSTLNAEEDYNQVYSMIIKNIKNGK